MADKIQWGRIRYAYVSGNYSYRDLAKKYSVSMSRLSSVAKNENWRMKRKQYRDKVGTAALSRACARDAEQLADKLDNLRAAADALGEQLSKIASDPEQLFRHTAVIKVDPFKEIIGEKRLHAANPVMIRALAGSLKDVSTVIRNLYDLPTAQEKAAQDMAEQRLALERERLELEREKAGQQQGDNNVTIEFVEQAEEAAQ